MNEHEQINDIEFRAKDMEAVKAFFATVFGWDFVDCGPEFSAFSSGGLAGGFFQYDLTVSTDNGNDLVIIHSKELDQAQSKIEKGGGTIIKPIFSFPGGRRFHLVNRTVTNMQYGQTLHRSKLKWDDTHSIQCDMK